MRGALRIHRNIDIFGGMEYLINFYIEILFYTVLSQKIKNIRAEHSSLVNIQKYLVQFRASCLKLSDLYYNFITCITTYFN